MKEYSNYSFLARTHPYLYVQVLLRLQEKEEGRESLASWHVRSRPRLRRVLHHKPLYPQTRHNFQCFNVRTLDDTNKFTPIFYSRYNTGYCLGLLFTLYLICSKPKTSPHPTYASTRSVIGHHLIANTLIFDPFNRSAIAGMPSDIARAP